MGLQHERKRGSKEPAWVGRNTSIDWEKSRRKVDVKEALKRKNAPLCPSPVARALKCLWVPEIHKKDAA